MPLTDSAKNIGLDDIGASATHIALFNGDPSGVGVEISGGSYARQSITWNTASAGNLDSINTPTFTVPAGSTVNYLALYTALTGGTLLGYRAITSQTFATEGSLVVSDFDIALND